MSINSNLNLYNPNVAVSMNHYGTDKDYCSYQLTFYAQVYSTTTYYYLYLENLYNDPMEGFIAANINIVRIA